MKDAKNLSAWVEAGYDLFAHEGIEGLQVERLARILALNKSGFYHYFGDLEGYFEQLVNLHVKKIDLYFEAVQKAKSIDPDYLHILVDFKIPTLFHKMLEQLNNNARVMKIVEQLDRKEDVVMSGMWTRYLGVEDNPALANRYLAIIRDMFYARVNFKNYTFPYLQNLFAESRAVMNELADRKNELEAGESSY